VADGERVNRIQRLRGRVKDLQAEVRDLKAELALSRDSVRDVNPDLPLPDDVRRVVDGVLADKLTYLTPENVAALARLVLETERRALPGLIVEAGTALGGSAIAMAAAKSPGRPMKVYDVFGMIPEPSERDGVDVQKRYEDIAAGRSQGLDGTTYYGYREDLLGEVTASFTRHGVEPASNNVELVQGLFQDTIHLDEPVALAHLDGDWYDSTMVCLERITPLLVPGGRLVLDDYYFWSGCREATNDYFAQRSGYRLEHRSKLHVVREQRTG
jgi:macrocin-O-methyltransferase TylF-like protien